MTNRIVLQITDFLKFVLVNPNHILHFLNQYFEKHMESMQYCEEIDNGFLFIFKDFEIFKLRGAPIKKELLIDIPEKLIEKIEFFKSFFLPESSFPAEGIEIEIKVATGDPSKVKPVAERFILSVDPDIIIIHPDAQTLVMKVPRYEIVKKYVNSLVRRFYLS